MSTHHQKNTVQKQKFYLSKFEVIGYFSYILGDTSLELQQYGFFQSISKEDPSKYEVFRFYEVNKNENNDQEEEIVDWKTENMLEVIIDCSFFELVSVNVKKHPIYVMNRRYTIDGSITFKFGMEGVYFIRNKIIYDSMTIVSKK